MKEIELLDAFCAWLTQQGHEFKREVRKRSYHNEGYCDVVIRSKTGIFVGVEAKVKGFSSLVSQVKCNRSTYHWNYALYPRVPPGADRLAECGLIIPVDLSLKSFEVYRKARFDPISWWCLRNNRHVKTNRNWDENRVGRRMHAKELPENYSAAHLESTYDWTKKPKQEGYE